MRIKGECVPAGGSCNSFCEMSQEEYKKSEEEEVTEVDEIESGEGTGTEKNYDGEELTNGGWDNSKNYGMGEDGSAKFGADLL